MRWWNRSQRTRSSSEQRATETRPAISERSSEPPDTKQVEWHSGPPLFILTVTQTSTANNATAPPRMTSTVSAPPIISTAVPIQETAGSQENEPAKKYAKTLRLTSDQLKQLDLKPGANTVTFALSASGVVACTARIFVWDHTDSIVISDIDGTITKCATAFSWRCSHGSLLSSPSSVKV